MNTFRLIFLLGFTAATANAQLTITSSDISALKGVTQTAIGYSSQDTTGLRALINASGSGRTWNVTGRAYQQSQDTILSTYLNPGGAPFANDPAFTSSNLVHRLGIKSGGMSITLLWLYLKLETTGLSTLGGVFDSAGTPVKATYSPPDLAIKFPLAFNTSWSSQSTFSIFGAQSTTLSERLVDGEGTVVTPAGSFPCLRLRTKTTTTVFGSSTVHYNYFFQGKTQSFAGIFTDANLNPFSVSYNRLLSSTATSVQNDITHPDRFSLAQNYPNPFNPSTMIEYELPQAGFTRLAVYNLLGQEVAVLVESEQGPGYYRILFDGVGLPSGVYLYHLVSAGSVKVGKMSLVK